MVETQNKIQSKLKLLKQRKATSHEKMDMGFLEYSIDINQHRFLSINMEYGVSSCACNYPKWKVEGWGNKNCCGDSIDLIILYMSYNYIIVNVMSIEQWVEMHQKNNKQKNFQSSKLQKGS